MSPLLVLLSFQGAPPDPLQAPAYAKPITVVMALAPLGKVVDAMAKASGLPIGASGVVSDLKATVLVKGLPVGRTMEALGDALGLVWKSDGTTLRLSRPDGGSAAEAAYRQEEIGRSASSARQVIMEEAAPQVYTPGGVPTRRRRGPVMRGGKAVARFVPEILAVEVPEGTPPSRLEPAGATGDSAFAKAAAAWPGVPKEIPEAWNAPVAPAYPTAKWLGGKLSLADLLVAWHAKSGLPVVADAFRVPVRTTNLPPGGALAVLQAVSAAEGGSLRFADGVARMRHPAFWRLRAQEIPESTWRSIEDSKPTLETLSNFATGLKPAQAATFLSLEPPLSKVDTTALREAYPALLLWSALPGGARSSLLGGRAVGLAEVQGASGAYAFALREAPYYGAGDPREVLAMNPAKVGIFGRATATALSLRLAGEQGDGVAYTLPL